MSVYLYFTAILLTAGLAVFLAVYAWRRRGAPGARAFAGLALGEAFLALTELLSLLSPTPALALFWFKLRYPALAVIPVLWLVFALEYSGRRAWLSRRLLIGLYVIPLVTQLLLWSNSLHGLWVKQEVGFRRSAAFWLAEPAGRLPAVGFLTHAFYGMFLLLAGIGLLLDAAWRMRRQHRWQAALVAGAGITALVIAFTVTFNLLPQTAFNPFTPGIGLSTLLIALAVFRFQFLKHAPAAAAGAPARELIAQTRRGQAVFLLIFLAMAAGLVAVGLLSYQDYERRFRDQAASQLAAIAALKAHQLEDWRAERLTDGRAMRQNPVFAALAGRCLAAPADTEAQAQMLAWLDTLAGAGRYDRVFLLDTAGHERLAAPAAAGPTDAHLAGQLDAVLAAGEVSLLDFHRDLVDGPIHLAVLIPILAEPDDRPLGLLVLHVDPNAHLYPYIQQWPVPSASAETLIVRRDGADVLFLNELRFQAHTALSLRFPLENARLPAARAALGQEGVIEGVDYRGAPVVAALRRVADSPWALVSKVDTAEVYAPLRERLWQTAAFFAALIATSGAALGLLWRQQRMRYYHGQTEAADALRRSQWLLDATGRMAKVGGWELDAYTLEVRWTEQTYRIHETPLDYQPTLAEALNFFHPDDRGRLADAIQAALDRGAPYDMEIRFITARGNHLWTRTICAPQVVGGKTVRLIGTFQDITERKRAEDLVRARLELMEFAAAHPLDAVLQKTLDQIGDLTASPIGFYHFVGSDQKTLSLQAWSTRTLQEFCRAEGSKGSHYPLDQAGVWTDCVYAKKPVIHNDYASLPHRKGLPEGHAAITRELVVPILRAGQVVAILGVGNKPTDYTAADVDLVGYFADMAWEVAERKQAEEAVKRMEERYRKLFEEAPAMYVITRRAEEAPVIADCNQAFLSILGYTQPEVLARPLADFYTPASRAELLGGGYQRALEGEFQTGERQLVARDGRVVETVLQARPELDAEGHVVGTRAMFVDITERKRREVEMLAARAELQRLLAEADQSRNVLLSILEDRQRAEAQREAARISLAQERNLLRTLIDNLPDYIYVKDREGRFVLGNVALARSFGKATPDEIYGKRDLDYHPPALAVQYAADEQTVIRTGQPLINREESVVEFDGTRKWLLTTKAPLRDDRGEVVGLVGIGRNITERKAEAEHLALTMTELARTNADLERFAYVASHDLQEPLRMVASYVQLLGDRYRGQLDADADDFIGYAVEGAQRMQQLLLDLLAYSHVGTHGQPFAPTDCEELLAQIEGGLGEQIAAAQAQITHDPLPIVLADRGQLAQVFAHLIFNALKFRSEAPPRVHVSARLQIADFRPVLSGAEGLQIAESVPKPESPNLQSEWLFSVRDNGIGIEPQYYERIFVIFQRLHTRRVYQGNGIGLALCKKIVERHGGRIWVESALGQGSTFYFTLPANGG